MNAYEGMACQAAITAALWWLGWIEPSPAQQLIVAVIFLAMSAASRTRSTP
jgi:hypothetical protein